MKEEDLKITKPSNDERLFTEKKITKSKKGN